MPAQLNHTIIWSSDPGLSAQFLTKLLGLSSAFRFGRFHVVELGNGVSLDFAKTEGPIQSQHYAFLIDEGAFDAVMAAISALGLDHWADPMRTRPASINRDDGGRGVYFLDPDGHLLEVITQPYGSGV